MNEDEQKTGGAGTVLIFIGATESLFGSRMVFPQECTLTQKKSSQNWVKMDFTPRNSV